MSVDLIYIFSSFHRSCLFFFNDTATTEIYTLSLHDALPILASRPPIVPGQVIAPAVRFAVRTPPPGSVAIRSEEHTSELQSHVNLVCRLLLEKKKTHLRNSRSPTLKLTPF